MLAQAYLRMAERRGTDVKIRPYEYRLFKVMLVVDEGELHEVSNPGCLSIMQLFRSRVISYLHVGESLSSTVILDPTVGIGPVPVLRAAACLLWWTCFLMSSACPVGSRRTGINPEDQRTLACNIDPHAIRVGYRSLGLNVDVASASVVDSVVSNYGRL
ncbi:hypothetical protein VPNG_05608 [Cytospora leucostoma]|uniref:Uncharacterized protein n=1 Tax=Cytospora leucostoma TaxID=1230097 RepID=A0A423X6Y6_9PEZI|nr:hypothetical protein VPNG_05608 [Cytospora leucostoma]